jgi:hypothetical protein
MNDELKNRRLVFQFIVHRSAFTVSASLLVALRRRVLASARFVSREAFDSNSCAQTFLHTRAAVR